MPRKPGWKGSKDISTEKLSQIAPSLQMLVVGSQDQFASSRQGKVIFEATGQIPADQKRYVTIESDDHGTPPLIADHSSPLAYQDDGRDADEAVHGNLEPVRPDGVTLLVTSRRLRFRRESYGSEYSPSTW